jgi:hypothetical protein
VAANWPSAAEGRHRREPRKATQGPGHLLKEGAASSVLKSGPVRSNERVFSRRTRAKVLPKNVFVFLQMGGDMPRKPKRFWIVSIEERQKVVFRRRLPGNLSENEIAMLLQRLACRKLSANEIVNNSERGSKKSSLLEVSFSQKGKRPLVWLTYSPLYTGSLWDAGEILDEPEIALYE